MGKLETKDEIVLSMSYTFNDGKTYPHDCVAHWKRDVRVSSLKSDFLRETCLLGLTWRLIFVFFTKEVEKDFSK